MVVNFFVQNISPDPAFNPELLFWEPFGFMTEKNPGNVADTSRKERDGISYILKRLQAECLFRLQVAESHGTKRDLSNEHGIFRLSDRNLFNNRYNVIWQSCNGCAFVMVLTVHENKVLAESILSMIVKYAVSIFDMSELSSQLIVSNPDKMACILNVFLPAGQLLILNQRLVKILQKDLEKLLADKT